MDLLDKLAVCAFAGIFISAAAMGVNEIMTSQSVDGYRVRQTNGFTEVCKTSGLQSTYWVADKDGKVVKRYTVMPFRGMAFPSDESSTINSEDQKRVSDLLVKLNH